ncbi:Bacteriohemerythrin [Gammaproteobacteria bacterium]
MAFIVWDDKYSVGIESIDYQHKKLFNLVDKLYDAMLQKKDKDILGDILVELIEYTSSHFSDEESHMMRHHYPEYNSHKKEHDALKDQVMALFNKFDSEEDVLSISIMNFLKDWLKIHILKSDLLYADYIVMFGLSVG